MENTRALTFAFLVISCVARGQRSAAAECPATRLYHQGALIAVGAAAARETTMTDTLHLSEPYFVGSGQTTYDLPHRHFTASVVSDLSLYSGGEAVEEYTIVGLPAGQSVGFSIRLHLESRQSYVDRCYGQDCTPQSHGAVYGEPDELPIQIYVQDYDPGNSFPVERTIESAGNVQRVAGVPFLLRFEWWAGTSHTPSAAASDVSIAFEGLPPGARIVGCTDAVDPVSALRTTWGALKSQYR